MRVRQSLPVLFLLLLVTAGLFAMHTTGHASLPGSDTAHMTSDHGQPLPGTVASHPMLAVAKPQAMAVQEMVSPLADRQMPGMMMAVCVAILCGALTALFALFLLRRLAGSTVSPVWRAAAGARTGRGPPALRIGLLIADLSVARN